MRPKPPSWLVMALLVMAPLACAPRGQAQEAAGAVRGAISDAEFGGPVPEAVAKLLEPGLQAQTGPDGHFVFPQVLPGSYTLLISKAGYERFVYAPLVVTPGAMTEIEVALKGEFAEMDELVVRDLNLQDASTEAGLLSIRSTSLSFQDSVSKELMSKAGVSDAAGALRLVVGATVTDGKYASVRGLSDRYVGASLNGQRVPSADPKKRAVHMDIFPAGTIESISVSKTFLPDLPGDYTGGGVAIRTVSVPEQDFFRFSFSREQTQDTGKDGYITYNGGGCGQWGRHNGARDMPTGAADMETTGLTERGLVSKHETLATSASDHSANYQSYDTIASSLSPTMGTKQTAVPANSGLALSGGQTADLGDGWKLGGLGAFTYSRKFDSQTADETVYSKASLSNTQDTSRAYYTRQTGTEELKWGTLFAAGLKHEDDHEVSFSWLRNRVATDRTSLRIQSHNETNDVWGQQQAIHYTERSVSALQFSGRHDWETVAAVPGGLELEWFASHNTAEQEEPDVRYFKNVVVYRGSNTWEYQFRVDGASGADEDSSTRIWRNTKEDNTQYGLNLTFPLPMRSPDLHQSFLGFGDQNAKWAETEAKLKLGTTWDWTRRWYSQNSFYYTFATQNDPTYTGPERSDYPNGRQGLIAWTAAREAWYASAEGLAYQEALTAAAEDGELRSWTTDDPNALWTDIFTDDENVGTGEYVDSMYWYVLPKFRDVSYDGAQNLRSGYWMVEVPLTRQLKAVYGARVEVTDMTVDPSSDYEDQSADTAFIVPVKNFVTNSVDGSTNYYYTLDGTSKTNAQADIVDSVWLRAMGLVYELDPGMNLRANYGQTIARPTFLELAPVITYDYVEGEAFIGNNDLRLSRIENFDLRWEWFRKDGGVLAASLFYKRIVDPIERESFGYLGEDYILVVNYPSGRVRGMEYELRQALPPPPGLPGRLNLNANYSVMEATVKIPDAQQDSLAFHDLWQDERDMEGQPEYLLNVNLSWNIDAWGTSFDYFFNVKGDTLKTGAAVGDGGATPNVYTLRRETVSLGVTKKFFKVWEASFRMKNLTDPVIKEVYREPDGTETQRKRYHEGESYTVSLSRKW